VRGAAYDYTVVLSRAEVLTAVVEQVLAGVGASETERRRVAAAIV
jgi:hypothetical protein